MQSDNSLFESQVKNKKFKIVVQYGGDKIWKNNLIIT